MKKTLNKVLSILVVAALMFSMVPHTLAEDIAPEHTHNDGGWVCVNTQTAGTEPNCGNSEHTHTNECYPMIDSWQCTEPAIETKPEEIKPEETVPEETVPEEIKPEVTVPEVIAPIATAPMLMQTQMAETVGNVQIEWSRSEHKLPSSGNLNFDWNTSNIRWNWSDVQGLDTNITNESQIWDGTKGNKPNFGFHVGSGTAHRSATWKGAGMNRFTGTFAIPSGFSTQDELHLASVVEQEYTSATINGKPVLPINDDIFVFIYKNGENITDENFMDYLAFWSGVENQKNVNEFNGVQGTEAMHFIPGTKRASYEETNPAAAAAMRVSDGWACAAPADNIGEKLFQNYPTGTEGDDYVIDVFTYDTSAGGGGGMDALTLNFKHSNNKTVTVQYWKDSVGTATTDANYIGELGAGKNFSSGDKVTLTAEQANAKKSAIETSELLYADGVQQNAPFTVSEYGENVINVVYTPRSSHNVIYQWGANTIPQSQMPILPESKSYQETASVPAPNYAPIQVTNKYGTVTGVWNFKGWETSPVTTIANEAFEMPNSDVTATGIWELTPMVDVQVWHYFATNPEPGTSQRMNLQTDNVKLTSEFINTLHDKKNTLGFNSAKTVLNNSGIFLPAGYEAFTYAVVGGQAVGPIEIKDNEYINLQGVAETRLHMSYDPYFPVTAKIDNGTVSVEGTETTQNGVNYFKAAEKTIVKYTPAAGYHVVSVKDNGIEVAKISQSEYQLEELNTKHEIVVTTARNQFTLTEIHYIAGESKDTEIPGTREEATLNYGDNFLLYVSSLSPQALESKGYANYKLLPNNPTVTVNKTTGDTLVIYRYAAKDSANLAVNYYLNGSKIEAAPAFAKTYVENTTNAGNVKYSLAEQVIKNPKGLKANYVYVSDDAKGNYSGTIKNGETKIINVYFELKIAVEYYNSSNSNALLGTKPTNVTAKFGEIITEKIITADLDANWKNAFIPQGRYNVSSIDYPTVNDDTANNLVKVYYAYVPYDDEDDDTPTTPDVPTEEIPGEEIPLGPVPTLPTDPSDPSTPGTTLPTDGTTGEVIVVDETVPLGKLPKTGTKQNGTIPAAIAALTALLTLLGVTGLLKKDKQETK